MGRLYVGSFSLLRDALSIRIAREKASDPLAPVTVITGSGAVARRVGRDLARALDGWANVRLATLHAVADELAAAGDGADGAPPPDRRTLSSGRTAGAVARRRLVSGLVADLSRRGDSFWRALQVFPGVPAALLRTLDDLRLSGVRSEDAVRLAASERGRAVAAALAAYEAALARRGLADDAATYEDAAAVVRRAPHVLDGWGFVCIFGLYDYPDRQAELLEAVVSAADGDVFVPSVASGGEFGDRSEGTARAWVDGEERLGTPSATGDLETLRRRMFVEPGDTGPAELLGDGSLAVVSVADEAAEIRAAAQELLRAAAAGVPFHDMAVVAPDAERCRRVASLLTAWDVPVAGGVDGYGAGAAGLAAVLDCVAPVAGGPYSRRAVLQAAAVAVSRGSLDADVVARWAGESREAGVVGGADDWAERMRSRVRWMEERRRPPAGEVEPTEEGDASGARADAEVALEAARSLERFVGSLIESGNAVPDEGSWETITEAVVDVAVRTCGLDAADEALGLVGDLESLEAVEREVELRSVAAAMRQLLAEAEERRGESGRHGVTVGRPESLRGLSFDTIVFTGLAEGGFPARPRQDPLLLDEERVVLGRGAGARLPLAADREAEDRFLFALTLAAAERRLVLVVPRGEAGTGRPRMPSRTAVRVCESLAGRPVSLDDFGESGFLEGVYERVGAGERGEPLDVRDYDLDVMAGVRRKHGAELAQRYFGLVHGDTAAARIRLRRAAAAAVDPGCWDAVLETAEGVQALAAIDPFRAAVSPSALEEYLRCPFRFYLTRILRLRIPEDAEEVLALEPRERGLISHRVLERVFREAVERGAGREETVESVDAAAEVAFAKVEERGVTGLPYVWELVRDELCADLREAVAADPSWEPGDGLRPTGFELSFGGEGETEVLLDLDDGCEVRFKGRMDRLDATPDGSRLRVVDYKTGGGSAERENLRRGLSVQLAVYVLAAQVLAREEGRAPSDVESIYRFVSRRGGFVTLALEQSSEEGVERLRVVTAAVRDLVAAGVFPRSPRQPEWICGRCDLAYACDDTVWSRRRKRGSDRLAGLVALQEQKTTARAAGADTSRKRRDKGDGRA